MSARTLLKMTATEHCIVFRTITRTQKSSFFYAARDELAELGHKCEGTSHAGSSFAVFHRDAAAGILTIRFACLNGGTRLTGREEIIRIPYANLARFMAASTRENGPQTWKCLSIEQDKAMPRFVFCNTRWLRECLSRKDVRRKLLRFLAHNFQWPGSDQICFYRGSTPYSFYFREIRKSMPKNGKSGGTIFHVRFAGKNKPTVGKSVYPVRWSISVSSAKTAFPKSTV